jgi:hypothetical protein
MRDAYERHLAAVTPGLYESQYLKANSPANDQAFWIKHNLLVPPEGGGVGEFWLIWFQRGEVPRVWKREVPAERLQLEPARIGLAGDQFRLDAQGCAGKIGDASWQLGFSGGLAPIFHFASERFYTASFPRKKLLTPAPNLQFDGTIELGEHRIEVKQWIGLRGHNWGREHAFAYAYGGCNVWDDGATDRVVDGFTARVRLVAGVLSPWMSGVVFRDGAREVDHNRKRDWFARGAIVEPRHWHVPYRDFSLDMEAGSEPYVGLRYRHPDGRESYCYNTKFAAVTVEDGARRHTSSSGELEVLYAHPLPGVALHPSDSWTQRDGDYHS